MIHAFVKQWHSIESSGSSLNEFQCINCTSKTSCQPIVTTFIFEKHNEWVSPTNWSYIFRLAQIRFRELGFSADVSWFHWTWVFWPWLSTTDWHWNWKLKFVLIKFYFQSSPTQTVHVLLRKAQQVPWIDWTVIHIDWRSTPLGFRKTM